MNVYLDTKKSSSSFNSVLYAFNPLFESTLGMPGSSKKHPGDKTESVHECIPICKKASPYFKSLKYYLKKLWACLDIILKKTTLICDSLGSIPICEKLT